MTNKMIRVEVFVDNKREGLIQLEATKGFVSIIKNWLDRQVITEIEESVNKENNTYENVNKKGCGKEFMDFSGSSSYTKGIKRKCNHNFLCDDCKSTNSALNSQETKPYTRAEDIRASDQCESNLAVTSVRSGDKTPDIHSTKNEANSQEQFTETDKGLSNRSPLKLRNGEKGKELSVGKYSHELSHHPDIHSTKNAHSVNPNGSCNCPCDIDGFCLKCKRNTRHSCICGDSTLCVTCGHEEKAHKARGCKDCIATQESGNGTCMGYINPIKNKTENTK